MMTTSIAARILVAEDDVIVAEDLTEVLTSLGYDVVHTVHTGEDAIRVARESGIDLVLMDIRMPGLLDGIGAAGIIREEMDLPVVFLTAYSDDQIVARAKETGPFGYIVKPYTERDLKTSVELGIYRHNMESLLRESRERYRRLFEDDLVAHYVTTPDGKILSVNEAFADMIGTSSIDEALDLDPTKFYTNPSERAEFVEKVRKDGRVETRRGRVWRLDGTSLPVLENARGIFDALGNLTEIHGNLVDMTREREREEQGRQDSRMDAARTLAGGVAHDFNNLLSSIRVTSELLLHDEPLTEGGKADVETIIEVCDRAAGLVKDLLATGGGVPAGTPVVVDVAEVLTEMTHTLRRLLGSSRQLRTDVGTEPLRIRAHPSQLEQVITNLVMNARDAIEGNGSVRLRAERVEGGSDPKVRLPEGGGGWIKISLADSGPGIAQEVMERIFDPFYSTKKGAAGLGLSVVYGIVRDHGGEVSVHTEEGEGTTVNVYLPGLE